MSPTKAAPRQLRLERVIRTDRERAFAAWTRPELLRQWSAPEGMTIEEGGELYLRVGGRWRVVMLEPTGTRHEAFGTYREITPPERLVYTHQWRQGSGSSPETTLTVEFLEVDGGTRVVLTQVGFTSPESRNGHVEGWSSSLDQLERLFAEGA
ncbi:MAG: SRPBCC domain-containing protein [Gemmatimonadota bacterium]|nr:SRPBCC domain-containing protein [Gemmatimonadota bacterium]